MKKFIITLILLVVCLSGCGIARATQEKVQTAHEYKVVSVYQYIATNTNRYGGVVSQELHYSFTYIGDDGQLHQIDDFEHTEYGCWKVCIGDENKYAVKGEYMWLYLTEDTLKNIASK